MKKSALYAAPTLAFALAACQLTVQVPNVPVTPQGSPVPSAKPSASPTAHFTPSPVGPSWHPPSYDPSAPPSYGPSWIPSPGDTATPPWNDPPSAYPSPPCCVVVGKTTIISGTVYDESGAPVDGAIVRVTSLDASVPYIATTTTFQGSWVVNNIPDGANMEIVATKDGWTSRRRVGSFETQVDRKNIIDFGGSTDLPGAAYFISKYPEIASVEPGYDASNVDNTSVSYKLTLSEPLDSTNQNRFANAIRLFPANQYAAPDNDDNNGGLNFMDLKDQKIAPDVGNSQLDRPVDPDPNVGYTPGNLPNHPVLGIQPQAASNVPWDYSVKNGTLFLNDANTRANVTWDATGTVATLTFNAPLIADRTNQARYQVGLVATSATDRIVDKDNNQLGLDASGNWQTYPAVGLLIHATLKQPDLSLQNPTNQTPSGRWISTHQDASRFAVVADSRAPELVSVAYTKNLSRSSRFELTFNKPMAAYNGRAGGHVGDGIRTGKVLDMISFAVSDRTGGTANVNLQGFSPFFRLDPASAAQTPFGQPGDVERQFWLGTSSGILPYGTDIRTAESDFSNYDKLLLAINPSNPRTLFIYVVGVTNVFSPSIVELKVRAEGVPDPAGNTILSNDADQHQLTTSVQ